MKLVEMDSRFLPAFSGMTGNDGLSLPIVAGCMVFNIATWNRRQPRFPLSRIP